MLGPRLIPPARGHRRPPHLFESSPPMNVNDTSAATEELRRALAAEEGGRRWLRRLAFVGSIVLVLGGGLTWRAKHRPPPPAKYVAKAVESGDIIEKVQATGAVQPLLQVNVGAQVNGRVTSVPVDF